MPSYEQGSAEKTLGKRGSEFGLFRKEFFRGFQNLGKPHGNENAKSWGFPRLFQVVFPRRVPESTGVNRHSAAGNGNPMAKDPWGTMGFEKRGL